MDGSAGKALQILEKKENYKQIDEIVEKINSTDKLDFLTKGKAIFNKEDINETLEYMTVSLFHKGKKNNDIKYLETVKIIQETINRLKINSNFDMSIDNMLFKLWEEINK